MVLYGVEIQNVTTATIILWVVFLVAIAAVCSIARNTVECLSCPVRWVCAFANSVKNFCCFLCCTDKDEGALVWNDDL